MHMALLALVVPPSSYRLHEYQRIDSDPDPMMWIRKTAFWTYCFPAEDQDYGGQSDGQNLQVGVHSHCIWTSGVSCDENCDRDDKEEGDGGHDAVAFDYLVVLW
jgi:hypothetical protein